MEKEYWDCQNCGKIVEINGDDDFFFEVSERENINVPNPQAETVCGDCWINEGYKEEYERQYEKDFSW